MVFNLKFSECLHQEVIWERIQEYSQDKVLIPHMNHPTERHFNTSMRSPNTNIKPLQNGFIFVLSCTNLRSHWKLGFSTDSSTCSTPASRLLPKIKSKWNMNLVPGVLAHVQPSHPHVWQQHLGAGMSHKGPQVGGHGQLQTGGVAPIFQLICQQLHGHGLILPERLLQQVHC